MKVKLFNITSSKYDPQRQSFIDKNLYWVRVLVKNQNFPWSTVVHSIYLNIAE